MRSPPLYSKIPIQILFPPAQIVFSGCRRVCRWDRCSILCTTLEIVECIGSWLRQQLITDATGGLSKYPGENEVVDGLTDEVLDAVDWLIS
ncbi:hypothetical protein K402DRAFT_187247 [Aulographum hederae CBS 113979]|uniref:HAT C-terminal dimerisation domain-containing protein n=1 Tax=Aulographum hederae CBS 113979 TaxID=1176131 RepID=A0A6G1GPI3_9PEZI|nr:hypothetical protein K402DRAFT_187247 [Aulographum hederae CBS 113979]